MKDLKFKHVRERLNQEILIGAVDGKGICKRFTFHVWDNEYRVYSDGKMIKSSAFVEEALKVYNAI